MRVFTLETLPPRKAGKWNIFAFFLRFRKEYRYIFFNVRIEFSSCLLIHILVNLTTFFKPNFSSENHNFAGKNLVYINYK